jgi:hypothetical protein
MASPAAREPGPLVTRVRSLTVENVDPYRVGRLEVDPVLGREVRPDRAAAAREAPARHRWYRRGSGAGGGNPAGRMRTTAQQGTLAPGLLV